MSETATLLFGLQYGDSAFPTGAFAQSWGLETAAAEGHLRTPAELEAACRTMLRLQVGRTDAVAAAGCCDAAARDDLARVVSIDRRLSATRAAAEGRHASQRLGRRLIDVAARTEDGELVQELQRLVRAGGTPGNHACMLGAVAAAAGISARAAAALSLWGSMNGLLSAAVRLLPITHDDVQAALARLRPLVSSQADAAAAADPLGMIGAAPLLDIWAMRHETADVRLFAS